MPACPLVTVVIPTYNYGRYVAAAVDTALAQTYPAVEVVVVDDGSTDDTPARLARYAGDPRVRAIRQPNQGPAAARNTGVRAARGEFVAFLDSDDGFDPRKVELQMRVIRANPGLALVGTASRTFADTPADWAAVRGEVGDPPWVRVGLADIALCTRFAASSALARRDCFDAVGLFDPDLMGVEDRNMWLRIADRFPVGRVDLPLTWYRVTPGSVSKNAERMERTELLALGRAFATDPLRRRWALRRQAVARAYLATAWVLAEAGRNREAVGRVFRSFRAWPFSLRRANLNSRLARVRLLLGLAARAAGVRRPGRPAADAAAGR